MYSDYCKELTFELMALQNVFVDNALFFKQNVKLYDDLMQKSIENVEPYFGEFELQVVHQSTKEAILEKV